MYSDTGKEKIHLPSAVSNRELNLFSIALVSLPGVIASLQKKLSHPM